MFSERLKYLRVTKGLTQEELSTKLRIKNTTISNWEKDNILPAMKRVIDIADFFDVSLDFLCGRSDREERNIIDTADLNPAAVEHLELLVNDLRQAATRKDD